jgi:hypothetical protein
MPSVAAAAVRDPARGHSPPLPQSSDANTRPAKRKYLPWNQEAPEDTRPAKRVVGPERQDTLRASDVRLTLAQALFPGAAHQTPPVTKPPAHPADIITRVEAWRDRAGGNPISDDEGDSPIDWDEPDMIPSGAPADGSLPSWSRAPWPSWSRHNTRIEAKIDKARQFHGVFDLKELRPLEWKALRDLERSLDSWSHCCIVCDFKGNPDDRHLTQDCPDHLYHTVQPWVTLFLTRLQQLAQADTQSCPVCWPGRATRDKTRRAEGCGGADWAAAGGWPGEIRKRASGSAGNA